MRWLKFTLAWLAITFAVLAHFSWRLEILDDVDLMAGASFMRRDLRGA